MSRIKNELIPSIEKKFGSGSLMFLGDPSIDLSVSCIPTGSIALDHALGIGGLPRGRIVEIYGPESTGKSTVAQQIIAESQLLGGQAAYIDAEHALDPEYAKKIGVNIDELLISQPDNGEQALEIAEQLIRSNMIDIVVIDSVAALVPKAEIEGEMGDIQVGLQARLMSKALRKLTSIVSQSKTVLIFINQLREKVGIVFGNPEVTPGGKALKFYSSVRIDLRRASSIKNGADGDIIGSHVKAKIVKNKVAAPFKVAEFDLMFVGPEYGISKTGSLIDIGIEEVDDGESIISKSGAFYDYKGVRIGRGKESAKRYLIDNPDVANEIESEIRDRFGLFINTELFESKDTETIEKPEPKKKAKY